MNVLMELSCMQVKLFHGDYKENQMNIAIIGSGNIGSALGLHWKNAGHQVMIGVRDRNTFKGKEFADIHSISIDSIEKATQTSDVILLAIPPMAISSVITMMGEVEGKVIIDASNSISSKPDSYPTIYHVLIDKTKADIVKCFNSTGYENIINPKYGDIAIDMFMAGENQRAKDIARILALDCGFERCIDIGGSDKVQLLESMALAWINLAIMQKMGRNIAFKILDR